MTVRIFVPKDAAALALGAERVAKALAGEIVARGIDRAFRSPFSPSCAS